MVGKALKVQVWEQEFGFPQDSHKCSVKVVTPGYEKQTREISPTSCLAKLVSSFCDLLGITGTIWLLLAFTVLDALPAKRHQLFKYWAHVGPKKCSSRNERVHEGSEEKLKKNPKLPFLVRMRRDESQRGITHVWITHRPYLFRVVTRLFLVACLKTHLKLFPFNFPQATS